MLAISPMPVDSMRDREALEKNHADRGVLPALPASVENPALEPTVTQPRDESMTDEFVQPAPQMALENLDTVDATFTVDALSDRRALELPPPRANGTRPLTKARDRRPVAHEGISAKLAEKSPPSSQQQGRNNSSLFRRLALPVLLLLFVMLFIFSIVYWYNKYAAAYTKTGQDSFRPAQHYATGNLKSVLAREQDPDPHH